MRFLPALVMALALPAPIFAGPVPDTPAPPAGPPAGPADAPRASRADMDAARYLISQERYGDAVNVARRVAADNPNDAAARDLYGLALTRAGRANEAIPELTAALTADPKNVDALVHLGEAQMTRYAQGILNWKKVHGDSTMLGTITSDIPGAQAGGTQRYFPEGVPVIGETDTMSQMTRNPNEARNPRFDPGHSVMGTLRRPVAQMNAKERERYEAPAHEAMAAFDKALAIAADNQDALRGKAFATFALGDFGAAGEMLEKAANTAQTDDYLYKMAADAYTRADRANDAIRTWENLIGIQPTCLEAYQNLEDLYSSFRRARWERKYYAAMARLLTNRPDDALDGLAWVTDRHPEYAPGWRATGSAYLAMKDPKQAIPNLEKAISLDPKDGLSEYEMGAALLMNGDTDAAHKHLTKAAQLRPDYPRVWYTLGIVAEKENDPDTAIAAYEKAVELQPRWAEAHYSLGALLLERREGAEAVQHLERYLALKPDAPDRKDVERAVNQVKEIQKS